MGIPYKTAERTYEKGIKIQMKKTEKKPEKTESLTVQRTGQREIIFSNRRRPAEIGRKLRDGHRPEKSR